MGGGWGWWTFLVCHPSCYNLFNALRYFLICLVSPLFSLCGWDQKHFGWWCWLLSTDSFISLSLPRYIGWWMHEVISGSLIPFILTIWSFVWVGNFLFFIWWLINLTFIMPSLDNCWFFFTIISLLHSTLKTQRATI